MMREMRSTESGELKERRKKEEDKEKKRREIKRDC